MKLTQYFFKLIPLFFVAVGAKKDSRIIGGVDALPGEFPFAAAIHVQTSDSTFFCGGALLRSQWIFTSANCIYNAVLCTIQLGSTTLTQSDANRVTLASSEFYIHPDFDPMTIDADVGLIKLRMSVTLTTYLQNAYLYNSEISKDNTFTILGWGQTSDSEAGLSEHLQHVEVVSLHNEECKLIYGDQISDNMLCLEGNYNEGTCTGDNGSPLIIRTGIVNYVVGVASFISANGCESTNPSGFTRISPYYTWLNGIITGANATV